jgi:GxxExxY protein
VLLPGRALRSLLGYATLVIELAHLGVPVERQKVFPVYYKGELAGAYIADIVVDSKIILELKSAVRLTGVIKAQLINYLRLSKIQVGYLVNFRNSRVEWKRFVKDAYASSEKHKENAKSKTNRFL